MAQQTPTKQTPTETTIYERQISCILDGSPTGSKQMMKQMTGNNEIGIFNHLHPPAAHNLKHTSTNAASCPNVQNEPIYLSYYHAQPQSDKHAAVRHTCSSTKGSATHAKSVGVHMATASQTQPTYAHNPFGNNHVAKHSGHVASAPCGCVCVRDPLLIVGWIRLSNGGRHGFCDMVLCVSTSQLQQRKAPLVN